MSFLQNNPDELARSLGNQKRAMEESQTKHKAELLHVQYLDMQNFPLDLNAMALITRKEAEAGECIPFFKDGNQIKIATLNPDNLFLKEINKRLQEKYQVSLVLVSRSSFANTLTFYDKVVVPVSQFKETIQVAADKDYLTELSSYAQKDASASDMLTAIFGGAITQNSSDIHIEPEDHLVKVRYRVDGVLHDVVQLPKTSHRTLLSRLKLLAKLKLNVENEAQDGRISILNKTEPLDVRISVLPSSYGEAVVMRLLGVGSVNLSINDLGLTGAALKVIETEIAKPNGMIITTGPTGSGKTTTLYAFLRELNEPGVKIITLEDPVEYKVEGIQQTPIDHRVDFSFEKALRSVLRQDPDVVMVGEIRDPETAETALQAALTGHIVLTTLHTNDAAGAIPRLLTMGVKPFTIAPAVNAIIAQRLVRRLCQKCIERANVDAPTLEKITAIIKDVPAGSGVTVPKDLVFYTAKGCAECGGLGYKGRVGVYEVIHITDEMRELILSEPSGLAIRKLASANGTLSMLQDGLLKALSKLTDIEEVYRVVG